MARNDIDAETALRSAIWQVLEDGRIKINRGEHYASDRLHPYVEVDKEGCLRTVGKPKTAETLLDMYGDPLERAASEFCLDVKLIGAVVITESGAVKGTFERDIVSERKESGFVSWDKTPSRGSGGLGQCLLTTFRAVVKKYGREADFRDPWGNVREPNFGDLAVPEWSIWGCAGFLRMLADEYDTEDPILLTSGYNTGGLYASSSNDFRLRANGGNDRFMKHAAYSNDLAAVLG